MRVRLRASGGLVGLLDGVNPLTHLVYWNGRPASLVNIAAHKPRAALGAAQIDYKPFAFWQNREVNSGMFTI